MKKILIVGQNSYISKHLKNHLLNKSKGFMVNVISARTDDWKALDFGVFDCIVDAVIPDGSTTEEFAYHIDRDLSFALAEKAKKDGSEVFVYISSIHIYGIKNTIRMPFVIDKKTPYNPVTLLGKSKLAGETRIKELENEIFRTIILRLPLVYGPDCSEEYESFSKLLMDTKKIPSIKNELSAIHISTLCAFIQYLFDHSITGIFHPQNMDYISTLDLLGMIAKEKNLEFKASKFLALRYRLFKKSIPEDIDKGFGSVIYSKDIDL